MTKSLLLIAMTLAFGGGAYAQDSQSQQDSDPCARFKMRVVKPPENLDPKMVLQVDASLDQAMVVNPCPPPSRVATELKPAVPKFGQRQNAIAPLLKLNPPDGQLKSPSEVLKQFAAPKPNRN